MDGLLNTTDLEVGLILTSPDGIVVEYALHFKFSTSNNEVEYEVLVIGLRIAKDLRVRHLRVHSDLQLIIG